MKKSVGPDGAAASQRGRQRGGERERAFFASLLSALLGEAHDRAREDDHERGDKADGEHGGQRLAVVRADHLEPFGFWGGSWGQS